MTNADFYLCVRALVSKLYGLNFGFAAEATVWGLFLIWKLRIMLLPSSFANCAIIMMDFHT